MSTATIPITGRPVMQEVVEALTTALSDGACRWLNARRRASSSPIPKTNLQHLFLENNWTDKLPIVLPTEERVAAMLAHTSHAPDEVVGHMQPTANRGSWEYTVEKVAVNAVMAGAQAGIFPGDPRARRLGSVGARQHVELGLGDGRGERADPPRDRHELRHRRAWAPTTTPTRRSAAPMACCRRTCRAARCPGETFMGSLGNNYTYNNITFAENEERSPWEPLHVQKGFKPTDSVVSIFYGCRSTTFCLGLREKYWREHVRDMLLGIDAEHARRACCSTRSPRGSSSTAAASTPRRS